MVGKVEMKEQKELEQKELDGKLCWTWRTTTVRRWTKER